MTLDVVEDGVLFSFSFFKLNPTLPGQNKNHGVHTVCGERCQRSHLIFMDVMHFIYSTVFLSFFFFFFISSQHTKRTSHILGFSSIVISYIFLNGRDCGRQMLLKGDHVQLYNVCKRGKGDH